MSATPTRTSPAYITLALVPGIGHARLRSLLARFAGAEEVLGARFCELKTVPGMTRAAATAVAHADIATGEKIIARTKELGGTTLTPYDESFSLYLREIPDPPTLLFATGNLKFLKNPSVALVGTRNYTTYGAQVCKDLAAGCARAGLCVVSGMARGIDAIAHGAALDAGGASVGVLGNGLGVVYPAANRALYARMGEEGCLITEFPPGERPHAGSFPRRNRLISGLSRLTCVVEAGTKSGALITVDCALNQGRDVGAVPGPITTKMSAGCNRLIQTGAKPILGIADILEELGMETPKQSPPPNLPAHELVVFDALERGPMHVDDLAQSVRTGTAKLLGSLTSLEIRGLVTQQPGKVFCRS